MMALYIWDRKKSQLSVISRYILETVRVVDVYSYYGTLTWSRMFSFESCHFQWHWEQLSRKCRIHCPL